MSYARLLKIMSNQNGSVNTSQYLGTISSISPLKISTNDIELDKDNLLKIDNGETFNSGDEVLLLKMGALFIVIGKVVSV